jgi:hypothetical protein
MKVLMTYLTRLMTKTQVLFIQGGSEGACDADEKPAASLAKSCRAAERTSLFSSAPSAILRVLYGSNRFVPGTHGAILSFPFCRGRRDYARRKGS